MSAVHVERLADPSVGVVGVNLLAHHTRVGHDDDDALELMADAAVADLEAGYGVALLHQPIRETRGRWPNGDLWPLAVVPVLAGADVTVTAGGQHFSGFHVIRGTRPALVLTVAPPPGPLIATYTAGWPTPEAVPANLRHGIADQAALLFDARGATDGKGPTMSPALARAAARLRRVAV